MSKIERSEDLFSRKPYFESCRILHFSVNDLRWWYIIFSKIQLKMERSDTGLWLERSDSLPLHRHKLNMSELIDSNVDLFMYLIEGIRFGDGKFDVWTEPNTPTRAELNVANLQEAEVEIVEEVQRQVF